MSGFDMNFEGAIFDLDGTLLDSLYVWHEVDRRFFAARGLPVPENYGTAVAGMSYTETAEYTISTFSLNEEPEDIIREWIDSAAEEYAQRVSLKPGAHAYLMRLKKCRVKLAAATAMPRDLFMPCLEHLGIAELFDVLCSTDDTQGRGKRNGEIYLLAAKRLGILPERCAVFEDVLDGVIGARTAGMRACAVLDPANALMHPDILPLCDAAITDFRELLPKRAVIITAHCEGSLERAVSGIGKDDFILCADGGWRLAAQAGICPDLLIGDFDSSEQPEGTYAIRYPVMKDYTDTHICAAFALDAGIREIVIIGGLGGRIDHTIANLQVLAFIAENGAAALLRDGNTQVCMLSGGREAVISPTKGKLAVFAFGGPAHGVCIRGAKYELENGDMVPHMTLGMGNDFLGTDVHISVAEGKVLITWDNEAEA